jgi:hypothetical protein
MASIVFAAVATFLVVIIAACNSSTGRAELGLSVTPEVPPAPTGIWSGLLKRTPYPYVLSLPQPTRSSLDGTYVKLEQREGEPVHCLRCPDWGLEGGVWKLSLDRGIFRVYHEVTGWHSLGSFVVSRDQESKERLDQLVIFNDPVCPSTIGLYLWKLEEGELSLQVVHDPCSIRLRAINLAHMDWHSCQPPNAEAAVTDHWSKPAGCD